MTTEEITIEQFQMDRKQWRSRGNRAKMVIGVRMFWSCGHVLDFTLDHYAYQKHTVPYFDYVYDCEQCNKPVSVKRYSVYRIK